MTNEPREKPPADATPPSPGGVSFSSPPPESFGEQLCSALLASHRLLAGWRFLFYLVLFLASYLALRGALFTTPEELEYGPFPSALGPRWLALAAELQRLAAAVLPALVMARIERHPFGAYGLPRERAFGKLFWLGAVWGVAALTVLMLVMRGVGALSFGGLALHGRRIFEFAAYWGVFFLTVGLFEEFLMRGYSQFALTQVLGFWPAAILLSSTFGAIHYGNPGETWAGLLAAALIGLFFCLTLRRTGTLWFAVGFHASWDWGESFLYSVPDSGGMVSGHLLKSSLHGPTWVTGGSVGPEGSLLVFLTIASVWIAFDRIYRQAKYPKARIDD
jgi:membrane protease YdiL (CAAX protease family)